jgi:hypothetical protein
VAITKGRQENYRRCLGRFSLLDGGVQIRLLAGLLRVRHTPCERMFVRVSKNRISGPRIEKGPNCARFQCVFERARFDPIASCRVRSLVCESQTARHFSEHRFSARSLHEVFKPTGNLVGRIESAVQKVVVLRILEKALDQVVGHKPTVLLFGGLRMDTGPMRRGEGVYPRASTEITTNPALVLCPRNRRRAGQRGFDFNAQIHHVRLTRGRSAASGAHILANSVNPAEPLVGCSGMLAGTGLTNSTPDERLKIGKGEEPLRKGTPAIRVSLSLADEFIRQVVRAGRPRPRHARVRNQ